MVGGIVFVISICLFGGIYYAVQSAEGKEKVEDEEDAIETPATQMYEPQQQQPQEQQGGFMNNMMNQAQGFMNNQQAPWASNQNTDAAPPVPPPNDDANNDGIPDQFQTNLPPGFSAAIDPNSQ